MSDNLLIGNYIMFNCEIDGQVASKKAVLVDKYILENKVPRIEIGCIVGSIPNKEAYVLENKVLERFVILKENFLDYVLIQEQVYNRLNYLRLKMNTKVKIYNKVYGIKKIDEGLVDNIGNIVMIYTNEEGIKVAMIELDTKGKRIEVPLVNCIAL